MDFLKRPFRALSWIFSIQNFLPVENKNLWKKWNGMSDSKFFLKNFPRSNFLSNFQENRKKTKIKKTRQPPPYQPQFKQKNVILSSKKKSDFWKKIYFFILNSAQDFFSRFSLTATVQKLEICPLRILIIIHTKTCKAFLTKKCIFLRINWNHFMIYLLRGKLVHICEFVLFSLKYARKI